MKSGYIYVLSNPSFQKGVVKIGFTTRNPEGRMHELHQGSGVPTPFKLEYAEYVDKCSLVEREIHIILAEFRVNPKREFFKVSVSDAIKIVREIGDKYRTTEEPQLTTSINEKLPAKFNLLLDDKVTTTTESCGNINKLAPIPVKICQYQRCMNNVSGDKGFGQVYCEMHTELIEKS